MEHLRFLSSHIVGISLPWVVFLNATLYELKHLPGIILKGRPAHLANYDHFKGNFNQ